MKIVGAGFPRTGTLSTRVALETLGFGPCYHFVSQLERPDDTDAWYDAACGRPVDWHRLLGDFQSALDWPQSAFYRTLIEVFPQARVLLNVRSADTWYASMRETVYPASQAHAQAPEGTPERRAARAIHELGWHGIFRGRFEDEAFARATFDRWNAEVVATVPADRLLVMDVRQGWAPLCDFLGVPTPSTPFPHLNDEASFKRRFGMT